MPSKKLLPKHVELLRAATVCLEAGRYETMTRFTMEMALRGVNRHLLQQGQVQLAAGDPAAGGGDPAAEPQIPEGMLASDWRFLSAVFIDDRYVDFSDEAMLERAAPLWMPQTDQRGNSWPLVVYKDHDVEVDNWCGLVAKSWFQKAEGDVPAGVEGTIHIDQESEAKLCRGLQLGTVRATSAGLRFAWKPSHDGMDIMEFWWSMGTTIDGEVVRMIVTDITEVFEQSIVWEGADDGAKRIVAGAPAPEQLVAASLAAVAPHTTAKADEGAAWDKKAADTELRKWASSDGSGDKAKTDWPKYRTGFAWYEDGNAEHFGSYKLPHHTVDGNTLTAVWNGVSAAMNALAGGRGGLDIPQADRDGVYEHLAGHYALWGKTPPAKDEVLAAAAEVDLLLEVAQRFIGSDPRAHQDWLALVEDATCAQVIECLDNIVQAHFSGRAAQNLVSVAEAAGVTLELGKPVDLQATQQAVRERVAALQLQVTASGQQSSEIQRLQQQVQEKDAELAALRLDLQAAQQASQAKVAEVEQLHGKVAALEPRAQIGDAYLEEVRQEALRMYRLAHAGQVSETILGLITGAPLETAKAFREEYRGAADRLMPMKCGKCGSTEVARASAQGPTLPPPQELTSNSSVGSTTTKAPADGRPSAGLHDADQSS